MTKEKGYILIIIGIIGLFLITTIKKEGEIEDLNYNLEFSTDSLGSIIDSLKHEIDTLEWNNNIWDFDIRFNGKSLLSSIMYVESSYNDLAYNSSEDAVGCLQIRQCMVKDINRILKRKGSYQTYSLDDR